MFPIREDIHDADLIIACIRDTQLHTEGSALELFVSGRFDKLVSVGEIKLMIASGAGSQWQEILKKQVLFGFDEHRCPCFVKDGFLRPKPVEAEVALEGEVIPNDATVQ